MLIVEKNKRCLWCFRIFNLKRIRAILKIKLKVADPGVSSISAIILTFDRINLQSNMFPQFMLVFLSITRILRAHAPSTKQYFFQSKPLKKSNDRIILPTPQLSS